ncbi:MAG: methyltransferase domain-containing protein [archaeon]
MPAVFVGRRYKGRRTPTLSQELETLRRFKANAKKSSSIRRSRLAKLSLDQVTPTVARLIHEKIDGGRGLAAGYNRSRGLVDYNHDFRDFKLPSVEDLINGCPRNKVRVLDAGAGTGELGFQLKTKIELQEIHGADKYENPIRKKIEYHGVDVVANLRNNVRALDLVTERLPENFYDIVVSDFSLAYMTDKLKAIENMVNSLRKDGVLQAIKIGEIVLNGSPVSLGPSVLERLLRRPWLEVRVTDDSVFIRKTEKGRLILNTRFERAFVTGKRSEFKQRLQTEHNPGTEAKLTSSYSTN